MADPARPAGAALLVVLHDVAPPTWDVLAPFVAALDRLGPVPLSFLVVPDYHGTGSIAADGTFVAAMDRRLARGDELLLHGWRHADDAPAPRGPVAWLQRRVYTHEGEFLTLDRDEARRRLDLGTTMFARLGWPLAGFTAPAWGMGPGTRAALRETPLAYTTTWGGFHRLPDFDTLPAPGLVWSARSAWRRGASRLWCEAYRRRHAGAPVLRLGIHPADLAHAGARRYWLGLIDRLLRERTPLTKRAFLERSRAEKAA
jgi:predicted deacetylase